MKILIVGGTGILSSAVVNNCLEKDMDVYMINRGKRVEIINSRAKLIKCDIHDLIKVEQLLGNLCFDTVIDFLVYNVEQLKYSLSLFGKRSKQYIFISTTAVYNTSQKGVLTEESELVQHKWKYSIEKNKCEKFLKEYCTQEHINYTIIRPGVNFGNTRIPYGIYPTIGQHWTLIGRLLNGKPIITWNQGLNRHNITRVEDFAEGVSKLIGKEQAYGEAFNIVGDYSYTWLEVINTLGKLLGVTPQIIDIPTTYYAKEIPQRYGELVGGRAKDCVCSNQKLKSIAPDYITKYNIEEGLKKTIDFYKSNNYINGIDIRFEAETDRIISKYIQSQHQRIRLHYIQYIPCSTWEKITNQLKYFLYKNNNFILFRILLNLKKNE